MGKRAKSKSALADPSRLKSVDEDDDAIIQVVIETPKGSRNKYAFDSDQRVFELKKVLPAGMAFPYDFGFIPRTKAEDGDPTDVLVLMDEPAFPGCLLKCRLIGIIEGEQSDKKHGERNDRVVAVEKENHSFADIRHIDDLGKTFVRELKRFFVNYHQLSREQYRVIGVKGPKEARKRIADGIRAAHGRCNQISKPADLWDLERYLTQRRKDIDSKYAFRSSRLTRVFGILLCERRVSEDELRGLREDKVEAIRSCAKFLSEDAA